MPATKKTVYNIGFEKLEGGGYIATDIKGKRLACTELGKSVADLAAHLCLEIKKRLKSKITITIA